MGDHSVLIKNPNSFFHVIKAADTEDLDVLVDYITDKGEGRLALDGDICKKLVKAKKVANYGDEERELIRKEILLFGGNTLTNAYRGFLNKTAVGNMLYNVLPDVDDTVGYDTIVRDVAKHVGASFGEKESIIEVENAILLRIFKKALEKMSDEERATALKELGILDVGSATLIRPAMATAAIATLRLTAATALPISALVANAMSTQILGQAVIRAPMLTPLGVLVGPIGWALTGLWTIADLASPAYRITVPCVLQIAYIRNKILQSAQGPKVCRYCEAPNPQDAKFCNSCGKPMSSQIERV